VQPDGTWCVGQIDQRAVDIEEVGKTSDWQRHAF